MTETIISADVIDRVAARCSASGIPITRCGVATIVDYLEQESASHRGADRLVGGGERDVVHGGIND